MGIGISVIDQSPSKSAYRNLPNLRHQSETITEELKKASIDDLPREIKPGDLNQKKRSETERGVFCHTLNRFSAIYSREEMMRAGAIDFVESRVEEGAEVRKVWAVHQPFISAKYLHLLDATTHIPFQADIKQLELHQIERFL